MSKMQNQTLKGFRDFLPEEARARQYVEKIIRQSFENFGFVPLVTPTLEYASLLLGKYGKEADKLLYLFEDRGGRQVGLRYDQTVPTARVLSQYQGKLPKDFRRYQIQSVFRADKPQKGRFREFTQADADIFSDSPLADAEILAVYYEIFRNLGLTSLRIEFNDRELLINSLQEFSTPEVGVFSIIQSIDKLDKKLPEEVQNELIEKGLGAKQAAQVLSKTDKMEKSERLIEIEQKALELGVPAEVLVFNPRIARGLDYYTGLIFEGKIPEYGNSSVGAGGRYDNLIETLSGLKMPAVGFGLGFDRIVEICQELKCIPAEVQSGSQVLIANFPEQKLQEAATKIAQKLRRAGIATELALKADKLSKQFKLAEQKAIPYLLLVGEEELARGEFSLKNLKTGEQKMLSENELITLLEKQ